MHVRQFIKVFSGETKLRRGGLYENAIIIIDKLFGATKRR
jgi:hypothetical protein